MKPSGTRCFVDGAEEIGNDFKLKCEPKEGSLPLRYEWQKLSDSQKMPTPWLAGTAPDIEWYLGATDSDLNLGVFACVCYILEMFLKHLETSRNISKKISPLGYCN